MIQFSQPARKGTLTYVLVVVLALIALLDAYLVYSLRSPPLVAIELLALVFLLAAWTVYSLWTMRFDAGPSGITARFFPLSLNIPLSAITSISAAEKVSWWLGMGLRIGWKSIWFVSSPGPALRIEKKNGFFNTVVITPQDPKRFAQLLGALAPRKA